MSWQEGADLSPSKSCGNKIRHNTLAGAEKHLMKNARDDGRPLWEYDSYQCRHCGFYHCGRRPLIALLNGAPLYSGVDFETGGAQ